MARRNAGIRSILAWGNPLHGLVLGLGRFLRLPLALTPDNGHSSRVRNQSTRFRPDGFRSLAYLDGSGCLLISRKGHVYRGFDPLSRALSQLARPMVLDGEIVVLDAEGRSRFYDLLYHRGQPLFYAFDCLSLDGRDLRGEPLSTRKRILKIAVKGVPGVIYAQHFAGRGLDLFSAVRERDLEGVVAKLKDGVYGQDWFKIRNPHYSQYEGRRELFEKRRHRLFR